MESRREIGNSGTVDEKGETLVVNRGAWTAEEDRKLSQYVQIHGPKRWKTAAARAGLNRCGKSCRLRWLNYLRPNIKRGNISEAEEDLIVRLHKLLGNRWSLIAGRLPGRTDNEIKNYWNSHLSKKIKQKRNIIHKKPQAETNTTPPLPPAAAVTSSSRDENVIMNNKDEEDYDKRNEESSSKDVDMAEISFDVDDFLATDHHHHHQGSGYGVGMDDWVNDFLDLDYSGGEMSSWLWSCNDTL